MVWLVLGAAEAEAPARPAFERGNLQVEYDVLQGQIGSEKELTLLGFQGNVILTLQDEGRKLLLRAEKITVGLDLNGNVQVAVASGEVHMEVDLTDKQSGRVQHLVADADRMRYEGPEEKVVIKSPATITITSPTQDGGGNTMKLTPRKQFEFWLKQMPEDLRRKLMTELEEDADEPTGNGEKAVSEAAGEGTQ
jgi:lipopolysaccharide export system protein LptA